MPVEEPRQRRRSGKAKVPKAQVASRANRVALRAAAHGTVQLDPDWWKCSVCHSRVPRDSDTCFYCDINALPETSDQDPSLLPSDSPDPIAVTVLSALEVNELRTTSIVAHAFDTIATFCRVSTYNLLHAIARYYNNYT